MKDILTNIIRVIIIVILIMYALDFLISRLSILYLWYEHSDVIISFLDGWMSFIEHITPPSH